MPSIFNFVEKEGKHFAPIVNTVTRYGVVDGVVTDVGDKIVSGARGIFSKVKMVVTGDAAGERAELFSVNTEAFKSSN